MLIQPLTFTVSKTNHEKKESELVALEIEMLSADENQELIGLEIDVLCSDEKLISKLKTRYHYVPILLG